MFEAILLLLAAGVWWADRSATRQRPEKLERSVDQLQAAVHAQSPAQAAPKPADDQVSISPSTPIAPTATPEIKSRR